MYLNYLVLVFNIFFSVFILNLLLAYYCIILFLYLKNLNIMLPIITKKQQIYRIFIVFLIIIVYIGIFIWRIYNRNNIRIINWGHLYNSILNILELYEISTYILIFLSSLFMAIMCLILITSSVIIIYLRSIAYSVHLYLLQFTWYHIKIFSFILSCKGNITIFLNTIRIYLLKKNKKSFTLISNLLGYSKIFIKILITRLLFLPLFLLFSELYLYNIIHHFYYSLPWIFILLILRMLNQIHENTYGGTLPDITKTLYLYKKPRHFEIYKLNCLTLEIINN